MRLALDPFRLVLISLAGWVNEQEQAVIEYLQEKNRVLREQLGRRQLRFVTISAGVWRPGPRNWAGGGFVN
jgi:hypothetical protein